MTIRIKRVTASSLASRERKVGQSRAHPPASEAERPQVASLRVGFIPGVEPDVFARRWKSAPGRPPLELVPTPPESCVAALESGELHLVFARLPWPKEAARPVHAVPLWEEKPVAVVSIDNELSLYESLSAEVLAEHHCFAAERSGDEKDRIAIVATGIGYAPMPMSLARLHHRKDVTYRPLEGEPSTSIALVWLRDDDDELRQEFHAVVRGRTARSSR